MRRFRLRSSAVTIVAVGVGPESVASPKDMHFRPGFAAKQGTAMTSLCLASIIFDTGQNGLLSQVHRTLPVCCGA